jgi:hypothetical protein
MISCLCADRDWRGVTTDGLCKAVDGMCVICSMLMITSCEEPP